MFFQLALLFYLQVTSATYVISVYGDVLMDQEFFTSTYPWIIDNIGGELAVEYYLLGSGRYSVPQMCALSEMRMNTFLQAQYLKCEAEGNQTEECLCATGIDPQKYRQCVLTKGSLASVSASKYIQLGVDAHPVVEIGYQNTIFGVDDTWYLKKICTIFGDNQPLGCIKPFSCDALDIYPVKKTVVNFNCPSGSDKTWWFDMNSDESEYYYDFDTSPKPDDATTEDPSTWFTTASPPLVKSTDFTN